MLKDKRIVTLFLAFLLILFSSPAAEASSARALGLGSDWATITGSEALHSNPAALRAGEYSFFAWEIVGISAEAWNNLFKNDYLDKAEKDRLLDKIDDDGLLLGTELQGGSRLFVGPVAVFAELRQEALINFSPDTAELLLKGNQLSGEYDFDGTRAAGAVYGEGGLNFSTTAPASWSQELAVEEIYLGATYHYLRGAVFDLQGEGSIKYDANNLDGSGSFLVKYNEDDIATGSALDLGAYVDLNDKYSLGLSLMGLGSLTAASYTKHEYRYDEEKEEFEEVGEDGERVYEELSWNLPTVFKLDGKLDYSDNLDFWGGYGYTSYHTGHSEHELALATEFSKFSFLPLRTGVSYSTLQNNLAISSGLGLHLGPAKIDLGIADLTGLFNSSRGVKVAFSSRIEF